MPSTALVLGTLASLPLVWPAIAQSQQAPSLSPSFQAGQTQLAQTQCVPLQVVGSDQTEVTKTVTSVAANLLPGARTNWDTDWAVPGGQPFSQFRATIVSEAGGAGLDIDMYLKYSDQTAERVYQAQGTALAANTPLVITGAPQAGDEPYQINLRIGGVEADGITYTAGVVGCR